MNKRFQQFLAVCLAVLLTVGSTVFAPATSAEVLTAEISVPLPAFSDAYGVDLNLRLNPEYVDTAELLGLPSGINASVQSHQNGEKLKIGIASATAFSFGGGALSLRLSLKKAPTEDAELCKLLQLTVNERILWQASDCILLSGVADGGVYNTDRTVTFNEGTATLNGAAFLSGTTVSAEGEYTLRITDLTSRVRTVSFTVDKTAPVITVSSFDTDPSDQPLTVTATVNEGTLNRTSHTFTENGSFTFVATDAAGNRSEKTVTVSHLYETYTVTILNIPTDLSVLEGLSVDVSEWDLRIDYDNGMWDTVDVTANMVSYDSSVPGTVSGTVTYGEFSASFSLTVIEKTLTEIRVTQKPSKLTYVENTAFDASGMVVTAYYNNGTSAPVYGYSVTGYSSTVGTKTITVSYGGKADTFTVTVVSAVPSSITSSVYTVTGGTVRRIPAETSVSSFLSKINEGKCCKVYQGSVEVSGSAPVGTGMTVKLMDGNTVKATYTVIVTGDTNGDGKISVTDMIAIKAHVLQKTLLSGVFATAADTNGDGGISITDFIQVKAKILGKGTITAR